jgi:hypothetical protein
LGTESTLVGNHREPPLILRRAGLNQRSSPRTVRTSLTSSTGQGAVLSRGVRQRLFVQRCVEENILIATHFPCLQPVSDGNVATAHAKDPQSPIAPCRDPVPYRVLGASCRRAYGALRLRLVDSTLEPHGGLASSQHHGRAKAARVPARSVDAMYSGDHSRVRPGCLSQLHRRTRTPSGVGARSSSPPSLSLFDNYLGQVNRLTASDAPAGCPRLIAISACRLVG